MNAKTLRKKIRKLETRLQEGPAKLGKWKRKLAEMEKAKAQRAKRKAAAQATTTSWRIGTAATGPQQQKKKPSTVRRPAKAVKTPEATLPVKVKRKLNLTPERRAQLAAAMTARWVAKRAARETGPQNGSTAQGPAQ
jgi:hypothetical protein